MDADVPVPSPFQEMRVEEIICPRGENVAARYDLADNTSVSCPR
jgi:hypothetical protein